MGYGMKHHLKILLELRARFGKKREDHKQDLSDTPKSFQFLFLVMH